MFSNKLYSLKFTSVCMKLCRQVRNKPDFTKNTYQVQRGFYNYLQEPHLKYFQKILGVGGRVLTNLCDLEEYNTDWYLQARGSAAVVLKPRTTQEVSKIVEYCNANKLAVCIQGGNTGCSAGSVPIFDEVVLSTELMNEIIEIDEDAGTVLCQAGVILQVLDNAVAEKGLMVPLDLGAKASCHIGGNVATNAGGLRVLRHGNMHGNVLGLEIVKGNGEIIDCLKTVKKNNSGPHIKNLFIGSEGTLGIITKVALQCPQRPTSQHVAFLGLQSYEKVLQTARKAKQDLGEILSALEVMDAITIEWGQRHTKLSSPIGKYPFYLLIETTGSNQEHDKSKFDSFLESALVGNYILKGIVTGHSSEIQNTYHVERGFYNYLEEPHLRYFQNILGDGERVLTDLSDLEKYNIDWYLQARGSATVVLKPRTTEEVSKIVEYCNANKLAVCTQGGNTGCSASGIPIFDEIVLSTELMNEIIEIDENAGTVMCQAGVILQVLDNAVAEKGLMVPLDLGSKASCHIGGNVATNAGGLRVLRYGNLHGNVLGLEIVKANGEIIDCLKTVKKNNSGPHIKNLFIGSEGTLGIITKVALQCPPRPKSQHVAFLGLQSYEKVLETARKAKQDLGEILSALEVMDAITIEWGQRHTKLSSPIGKYPFYLLIETSGSNQEHDGSKMNSFLESALVGNYILNGTVTGEPSKIQSIWAIRERLAEGLRSHGWYGLYDLSLPIKDFYSIVDETRAYVKNDVELVFGFGHLGDGNLHLNVLAQKYDKRIEKELESLLTKRVIELKGSMSAEHGLGFLKRKYLPMVNSHCSYQLMLDLKRLLDPNTILNPYKVFP